jgi:uracil-DNA glycosylase family protein
MRVISLAAADDFEGWRAAARALALAGVAADEVNWEVSDEPGDLLAGVVAPATAAPTGPAFSVPAAFLTLAETVISHADPERFGLLYAMLLRLRTRPDALAEISPLLDRLERMARDVRQERFGRKPGPAALEGAMAGSNLVASWEALRAEAMGCRRCHLYRHATQTVFGEGPLGAKILFVGEQPGDQEDLAGRPFVGPAGQLFDRALADAGVDRGQTYVTNAVKHFKFERRGKRRIHQKPDGGEIEACRWWIEQERSLLRPAVTVALGATAARSLFGRVVTITRMRGTPHDLAAGGEAWVTVHPSFLLRVPEEDRRREEYAKFVEDLVRIGKRAKART